MGRQLRQTGGNVNGLVLSGIADAVAAAKVQVRKRHAGLVPDLRQKRHHNIQRPLVHILSEHLRAYMAVQAPEVQMGQRQSQLHQFHGLSGLHRRTEFGVHLSGADSLVGVGVNARRYPQKDLLGDVGLCRRLFQR